MLMVENLWLLSHILEVKPNGRDRLVRRVGLKTKSAVLEHPINNIGLVEAPRLHESSQTLLIFMSSIDCK